MEIPSIRFKHRRDEITSPLSRILVASDFIHEESARRWQCGAQTLVSPVVSGFHGLVKVPMSFSNLALQSQILVSNQSTLMKLKNRVGNNGLARGLSSCSRVFDLRHDSIAQAPAIRAAAVKAASEKAAVEQAGALQALVPPHFNSTVSSLVPPEIKQQAALNTQAPTPNPNPQPSTLNPKSLNLFCGAPLALGFRQKSVPPLTDIKLFGTRVRAGVKHRHLGAVLPVVSGLAAVFNQSATQSGPRRIHTPPTHTHNRQCPRPCSAPS